MTPKPYFYIIEFKELNLKYSGVRYANKMPAQADLLVEYFTSSRYVKELIDNKNVPSVYEIKEFDNRELAVEYELNFNKSIVKTEGWLNKAAFPVMDTTGQTRNFTDEHKKKISKALKGKPKSPDHARQNRERGKSMIGRKWNHSEETISKMSDRMTGHKHSEETKNKIGLKSKGRNKGKAQSPEHIKKRIEKRMETIRRNKQCSEYQ